MHILVIEDDLMMSRSIGLMLRAARLEYLTADTGERGIELARGQHFDAILLDLTLPDIDGHEVLHQLRLTVIDTPVIIVSGNCEVYAKVAGFSLGADDYVTKPFQQQELVARIQALIRRAAGKTSSLVKTGTMTIDLAARTTEVNGRLVHMTNKEYAVLELLSLHKGLPLTKELISRQLYSGRDEPDLRVIDVFVCNIRKKLSVAGAGPVACIETVWGHGYALRDPEGQLQVRAEPAQRCAAGASR